MDMGLNNTPKGFISISKQVFLSFVPIFSEKQEPSVRMREPYSSLTEEAGIIILVVNICFFLENCLSMQ